MPSYAYINKQFVPLSEAKLGIMTHGLHYGTALFEGIRGNWSSEEKQLYLFRLKEHYQRLFNGCRLLKINLSYDIDELCRITVELVERCGFQEDIYVRPLAYKSSETLGVHLHGLEDDFLVFAFPWGAYLDVDKAKCCVSSWRRPSETLEAKICGLYVCNAMAQTEAIENGCHEAIMLNADGYVAEGTIENIFLVIDGKLVTPADYERILVGITRDTVIRLARDELGLEVVERRVTRSELYLAGECFLCGTAANITSVVEIDKRKIGNGEVGKVTGELQSIYCDVIRGKNLKYREWCTPVCQG